VIGNDVVDLRDADSQPESFSPRFDARVFDDVERRAIERDPRPLARRWAHWGAKEAAYKLARQVDPRFVFAPIRLVARFEAAPAAPGRRLVRAGRLTLPPVAGASGREVELRSFEAPDCVHVIALPAGADWEAVESRVTERRADDAEPGDAVRRLARREVARSVAVPEARLTIGRRGRIPTLELDGEATALSLSLSHHGRWIAYAMTCATTCGQTGATTDGMTPSPDPTLSRSSARRPGTPTPRNGPGAMNWQTT